MWNFGTFKYIYFQNLFKKGVKIKKNYLSGVTTLLPDE